MASTNRVPIRHKHIVCLELKQASDLRSSHRIAFKEFKAVRMIGMRSRTDLNSKASV